MLARGRSRKLCDPVLGTDQLGAAMRPPAPAMARPRARGLPLLLGGSQHALPRKWDPMHIALRSEMAAGRRCMIFAQIVIGASWLHLFSTPELSWRRLFFRVSYLEGYKFLCGLSGRIYQKLVL